MKRAFLLKPVVVGLMLALASCQSTSDPGDFERRRPRSTSEYYGYTLKRTTDSGPFTTPRGHSYYYSRRDARSPYRDYLRRIDHMRQFGTPDLRAPTYHSPYHPRNRW